MRIKCTKVFEFFLQCQKAFTKLRTLETKNKLVRVQAEQKSISSLKKIIIINFDMISRKRCSLRKS